MKMEGSQIQFAPKRPYKWDNSDGVEDSGEAQIPTSSKQRQASRSKEVSSFALLNVLDSFVC